MLGSRLLQDYLRDSRTNTDARASSEVGRGAPEWLFRFEELLLNGVTFLSSSSPPLLCDFYRRRLSPWEFTEAEPCDYGSNDATHCGDRSGGADYVG
jgi:hypothetical protein